MPLILQPHLTGGAPPVAVPVALVRSNSGNTGTGAPATLDATLGGTPIAGDTLLLVVCSDATVNTPAGWTLDVSAVATNGLYIYRKTSAGTESTVTITPSVAAATNWWYGEYEGLDATPLLASSSSTGSATTTSPTGATAFTSGATGGLAIAAFGSSRFSAVTASGYTNGFTELADLGTTKASGTNVSLAVATALANTDGSFSSTATLSASSAVGGVIAIYEPGTPGGGDPDPPPDPPPDPIGYPSPTTVGWEHTGVTLTPYTGPQIITTAGTVIDSKDIDVVLEVRAQNVTIKRSRIKAAGGFGIKQTASGTGLIVEDVEITSDVGGSGIIDRSILVENFATLRRVYVHNTQRGIQLGGHDILISNCYIGDNNNSTAAHTTAILASGGVYNVQVIHCNLFTLPNTEASGAISTYPEQGPNHDFLFEDNLIASGGDYAVRFGYTPCCDPDNPTQRDPDPPAGTTCEDKNYNYTFINNKFSTRYFANCGANNYADYGPDAATSTWTGNTWYDEGNGGAAKHGTTVPAPANEHSTLLLCD